MAAVRRICGLISGRMKNCRAEYLKNRLFFWIKPQSHPARGAWIEMKYEYSAEAYRARRTPQGVRGLKF